MTNTSPKLFVSYSWSTPEHEEWVIKLATELRDSGIDVILDKWDLKEGNDAIAFMEKMVVDPTVTKVVMVCDKKYAEKADGRTGGVGTEAQIISAKVYGKVDQNKFVAVICELDESGKPFLPTYYASRIYIDLSDDSSYATNLEQLLRWAYDKPLYVKPKLGKKPAFLSDTNPISLETTATFRRALDGIKNAKSFAQGALDEYLDVVADNLENFRIAKNTNEQFDDMVLDNIGKFTPYRNELIEIFNALAKYNDTPDAHRRVHRFIEQIFPYFTRPKTMTTWSEWDSDNFKFIIHETFLYLIAVLLKHEKFEFSAYLIQQPYYVANESEMVSFAELRNHLQSLRFRNDRLKLNKLSLHSMILEERAKESGVQFDYLMQADTVLFISDCVHNLRTGNRQGWWPETLLYAGRFHGPFEIFARAQSKSYFDKLKVVFGIASKADLLQLFEAFQANRLHMPRWEFNRPDLRSLINFEKLATFA